MAFIAAALVFIAACTAFIPLGKRNRREKIDISRRLGEDVDVAGESRDSVRESELKKPLLQRIIKPLLANLSRQLINLFPAGVGRNLDLRLQRAGNPGKLTSGEFLVLQLLLAAVFAAAAFFLFGFSPWQTFLAAVPGWYIPSLLLINRAQKRDREIEKSLPDILDLLTVSVEAGLGFDAALVKVAEKANSILAGEFRRVIKEIRMGKSRRDALKDLARRLDSESITSFVGAVVQADQLGISFSRILRLQAEKVRFKRKQRAEEEAMKAPVKMLIPLILFVFPAIFIVLLGPAVLKIMAVF